MLKVYEVTRDKQGTPIMRHIGEVETWRETHRYRRLPGGGHFSNVYRASAKRASRRDG